LPNPLKCKLGGDIRRVLKAPVDKGRKEGRKEGRKAVVEFLFPWLP